MLNYLKRHKIIEELYKKNVTFYIACFHVSNFPSKFKDCFVWEQLDFEKNKDGKIESSVKFALCKTKLYRTFVKHAM